MSNAYDDMRTALDQARATMDAADSCVNVLVNMLKQDGRLRRVRADYLEDLKRQLTKFNSRTGRWQP